MKTIMTTSRGITLIFIVKVLELDLFIKSKITQYIRRSVNKTPMPVTAILFVMRYAARAETMETIPIISNIILKKKFDSVVCC
ncbi:MAG: hypothetical protein LBU09_01045 [Endomicrobium sp.]|jgi:hypothetical protein|nr:hypothetical protein [Endomicrobium sp.]